MLTITQEELEQFCKDAFGGCAPPEQAAIRDIFLGGYGSLFAGGMLRKDVSKALRQIGSDISRLGDKLDAS